MLTGYYHWSITGCALQGFSSRFVAVKAARRQGGAPRYERAAWRRRCNVCRWSVADPEVSRGEVTPCSGAVFLGSDIWHMRGTCFTCFQDCHCFRQAETRQHRGSTWTDTLCALVYTYMCNVFRNAFKSSHVISHFWQMDTNWIKWAYVFVFYMYTYMVFATSLQLLKFCNLAAANSATPSTWCFLGPTGGLQPAGLASRLGPSEMSSWFLVWVTCWFCEK